MERAYKVTTPYNFENPDWALLERAVQQAQLPPQVVGEFMWMMEQPQGTHQYKHRITRRYAILTATTCAPQILVREARAGYEPMVPYAEQPICQHEECKEIVGHICERVTKYAPSGYATERCGTRFCDEHGDSRESCICWACQESDERYWRSLYLAEQARPSASITPHGSDCGVWIDEPCNCIVKAVDAYDASH
jgi:hypothetical protein